MRERIIKWLLDNGYAEEQRGYGHVSAEDLADALLAEFHVEEVPTSRRSRDIVGPPSDNLR